MTPPAQDVMEQWFEQVWNQGNEEAIDRLLAPGCVIHGAAGSGDAAIVGPDAFKQVFRGYRAAFSNLRFTVEQTFNDGDTCIAYCRARGTHTGDAMGPATGKDVEIFGVSLFRVSGGQVIEGWSLYDLFSLYQQLGWAPQPPPAPGSDV